MTLHLIRMLEIFEPGSANCSYSDPFIDMIWILYIIGSVSFEWSYPDPLNDRIRILWMIGPRSFEWSDPDPLNVRTLILWMIVQGLATFVRQGTSMNIKQWCLPCVRTYWRSRQFLFTHIYYILVLKTYGYLL